MSRCLLVLAFVSLACGEADPVDPVPSPLMSRSTPEAQGIDSVRLRVLLEDLRDQELDVHSLTIARHGKIVLDARMFPWDGTRPHDVASVTKSLTSTALGIAVTQGAIESVDTSLVSYFPEYDEPAISGITLKHALTMTTGFDCIVPGDLTLMQMQSSPDWVAFALGVPIASPPGETWRYCSTATHLLSGVITRATGEAMDDLLTASLFQPLAAAAPSWPRDPQGISHGWGDARLDPDAMIRIGQLWLERGSFGGERVVDESYMDQASVNQVSSATSAPEYGYGFWIGGAGSYRADGRGGQNVFVVPSFSLVVAITGGQSPQQHQATRQRLASEIALGLADGALPPNPEAAAQLDALVNSLTQAPAPKAVPQPPAMAASISGKSYALASNVLGWSSVSLAFGPEVATLRVAMASGEAVAQIGLDAVPRIARGITFAQLERYRDIDVAMRGGWADESTFEIVFDTIDTIDAGTLRFSFDDAGMTLRIFEKTYLLTEIVIEGTI